MIFVEELYQFVNNDLAVKGAGGYTSNDEFNRAVADAQLLLFKYHCNRLDNSNVSHALRPFITASSYQLVDFKATLAADIERVIEGGFIVIKNGKQVTYPASALKQYEVVETLNHPIRKPSYKNKAYYYTLSGDKEVTFYSEVLGSGYLKCLRYPIAAVRAVTIDVVNEVENYTSTGTINLEWPKTEFDSFVNILLHLKGFQIKDEQLSSFLKTDLT
jgi:hypothetical protein